MVGLRFFRTTSAGALFALAAVVLGCARQSADGPVAPTTPATPATPAPATYTVGGTITATNGGQPIGGATVSAADVTATTDASGRYSLTLPRTATAPTFTLTGPGLTTRTGTFTGGTSRTVDLDAYGPGFDLDFFRKLARNGFESSSLRPLAHWTTNPSFYITTVDEQNNAIDPAVVQMTASLISQWVPRYSGGRYTPVIETGTGNRVNADGWVTVFWNRTIGGNFCGRTGGIGIGGSVLLVYDRAGCACGSQKIRPRTVKHELGHVMGLYHTGVASELMSGLASEGCDLDPSDRELAYTELLYRRPVGNTDPDNDPPALPH